MYGLTEAFRSTYLPPEEIYRGPTCIGKAIPNTEVWVLNEEGQLCSSGEVGELVHRGPTVTLGYWGDEEKTRSVFRSNPFASPKQGQQERVVYSGDLVKKDEEGFVYFQGRRDELIKSAGYRVSPQEVENLLCSIPGVWEAASFGKEDDVLGQRVVAIISLDPRAEWTAEEIQTACRQKAPPYLVPAIIHILRELPKTPTGKIDRAFLRNEHIKGKH
jgi:acyl-coenzyme A synthetase/AMP-(fatty) acid ligase